VCSVGDDQAFSSCEIKLTTEDRGISSDILSHSLSRDADVSALKGVCSMEQLCFVTAGYGGVLSFWRWSSDSGNSKLATAPVDIYDINAISCYTFGHSQVVGVAGEGIEIFKVWRSQQNQGT